LEPSREAKRRQIIIKTNAALREMMNRALPAGSVNAANDECHAAHSSGFRTKKDAFQKARSYL